MLFMVLFVVDFGFIEFVHGYEWFYMVQHVFSLLCNHQTTETSDVVFFQQRSTNHCPFV